MRLHPGPTGARRAFTHSVRVEATTARVDSWPVEARKAACRPTTSANVVVAGMSERAGQRISFVKFMLYGIPVTLVSLAVATLYVVVRYY